MCDVNLTTIVNTADDFEHWGLHISPDLDSVMYALADWSDPERGWGVRDESWNALESMKQYGGDSWFQLGDRDLATHLQRTSWLHQGNTLTEATESLRTALKISTRILPMSDDPIFTQVHTDEGWLDFQVYFVKKRCEPTVTEVRFNGASSASATDDVLSAIETASLIVICPSNPLVSVDPILSVPGIREALKKANAPTIAISPLINGLAIKGPTVEMMKGLGYEACPSEVAKCYADFLDGFVLDEQDAELQSNIEQFGLKVQTANTLMKSDDDKQTLAQNILDCWQV